VLIAEGGPKMTKKFRKKMANVKWNRETASKGDSESEKEESTTTVSSSTTENGKDVESMKVEEVQSANSNGKQEQKKEEKKENKCWFVWEGTALKANYDQFRWERFDNEAFLRKYLINHWSEQYWDMGKKFREETFQL
jgi:hypothetical protein